jgi:hypothetical protein
MRTPLLSILPWSTGTLLREDVRSIVDDRHEMQVRLIMKIWRVPEYRYIKPFLEHLHQFEEVALSQINDDANDTWGLLFQIEELTDEKSGTITLRSEVLPDANRRGWMRLASLVLAYRLADVIGLLNEVHSPQPHKMQRKRFSLNKFPNV